MNGLEAPWEELVTTALLGTERRAAPAAAGADDQAAALLDLAAVGTVRRRAGLRPAEAQALPEQAPRDPRPPLPTAARRRLALLLSDRTGAGSGGSRGSAPNLGELLPQWLHAARGHGYRAPAALLPALLDAARGRSDLRRDALALAGPRGLWLAGLNPDWKFALRAGPAAVASPEGGGGENSGDAERRLWEEGLFAERVGLIARLRARDARAALNLLRSTWADERAEDRLLFLDSLREGLDPDDEPFLEEALADRSKNVRATAAELLSCLPGSALAARMAARARACVALEPVGGGHRIVVEAPYECDAEMQRDGIAPKPPTGRGERAWWLGQLVEASPLSLWTERFSRSPEEIVALAVTDDWRGDLHAAWSRAAVRQRDALWARALLGAPPRGHDPQGKGPATEAASGVGAFVVGPVGTAGDPAKLLSVLPHGERALWVARFIGAHGLSEAFQLLGVCAVPWSEPLGRAVVDALDIAREAGNYPWSFSGVMGLAERCLDPAQADRVDALTAIPETDGAPGAGNYWSEVFQRLASTLRIRAAMLAELEAGPGER
ncbi:DUF5691 domain-containing protein [Wenjunlia tyrosinilytica]|uniref:Uncharacterized protein n=1 Tax=Wenjunlia tyrosinilytica TaxID=1544741 RepID=A0A917ZK28_9ACTN|nr:DUF5691 domain-containing protein [Wenjunlia tyrosinilytica]GGO83424.1 hypothetical protein GCM10012280_12390 [Wenjunlia tyrosinilytica]